MLQEHFVVPESAFVLIFGDPRHAELSQNSEERELKSDIGYVRLLYSYGLIGLFLHCAFYGVIIAFAARFLRRGHENIKGVAVFCVVTSLVMFAFNAKEVLFFSRMGLSVTCLSIAALAAFWRKEAMGVVSRQSPGQVEIRSPTPARIEGR